MKTLLKGEKGQKSTRAIADSLIVECIHQTVHKSLPDGARFQMTWNIDFDGMTQEQIMEAASEHLVIRMRRPLAKTAKPENDDWNNVIFKAVDYLTKRTDKVAKAEALVATFTDEQLSALGLTRIKSEG